MASETAKKMDNAQFAALVKANLVGWPIIMFLIAEPLRNLGKFTFADVVAYRLKQKPIRVAASCGSLMTVIFYLSHRWWARAR